MAKPTSMDDEEFWKKVVAMLDDERTITYRIRRADPSEFGRWKSKK